MPLHHICWQLCIERTNFFVPFVTPLAILRKARIPFSNNILKELIEFVLKRRSSLDSFSLWCHNTRIFRLLSNYILSPTLSHINACNTKRRRRHQGVSSYLIALASHLRKQTIPDQLLQKLTRPMCQTQALTFFNVITGIFTDPIISSINVFTYIVEHHIIFVILH